MKTLPTLFNLACQSALALGVGTLSVALAASPLFEGTTPNLWLLESSGEFSARRIDAADPWLSEFSPAGVPLYPLGAGQQALINRLEASSQALSANQPAISIAGLGDIEKASGDTSPLVLDVLPRGGQFSQSVVVALSLSKSVLDAQEHKLRIELNGRTETRTLSEAYLARASSNAGFYTQSVTLVADGSYALNVTLLDNSDNTVGSIAATYQINTDHPDGIRRDSDADGLPDIVEAAIGLDVYDNNWQRDSDNNGWSDFDEWLRQERLGVDGLPLDSDGDGWSDFDEELRGTNPNDPLINLPDSIQGEDARRQQARRFQHVPVAQRLYEVEYRLNGKLQRDELNPLLESLPAASIDDLRFDKIQAASLIAEPHWHIQELVTDAEITELGLNPSLINETKKYATAEAFLSEDALPLMRLPASKAQVLSADFRFMQADDSQTYRYKILLNPTADANPLQFQASQAASNSAAWETAEQWRQAYIAYLQANLVQSRNVQINRDSTFDVALLEGFLSYESTLQGLQTQVLMNAQTAFNLSASLEQELALALARLGHLTQANGEYSLLALFAQLQADNRAEITEIKSFLAQQWLQLPDALASDVFLQQQLAADESKRYFLRVAALPGIANASQNNLFEPNADSDNDGLSNRDELMQSASLLSLPWLSDSDGDTVADASDSCPLDSLNACTGQAQEPSLLLDSQISVIEPSAGGSAYALVSIRLDRVYEQDVVFDYQTLSTTDDSAVAGEDYQETSGQLVIAAGARVVLVRIPILADNSDETAEQFRLQISNVSGANFDGGQTLIAINEVAPEPPQALLAAAQVSLNERQTQLLDASLSRDPAGLSLSYQWQIVEANGLNLTLSQADQVQASLVAPELQVATTVTVRLTVSNSAGLRDSADLMLTINPVDDAPQVLSTPSFAVTPGETLNINDNDLLSYLRELEGQAMSIGEIIQLPSVGSLTRQANGFAYTQEASSLSLISGPWGRNAVEVDDDYLLFVEHDVENGNISAGRVVSYQFSTGRKTLLHAYSNDDELTQFYLAAKRSPVYFEVGNRLFNWSPSTGVQSVEYTLGKQALFVDSITGNALVCDADGTESWQLINSADLSLTPSFVSCNLGDFVTTVSLAAGFCVASDIRTACIDSSGALTELDSLEAGVYSGALGLKANNENAALLAVNGRGGNASTDQSFGFKVAVEGDWAVVGATASNNFSGKAEVFKRVSGVWIYHQTLTSAGAESFGWRVQLAGQRLVVSAFSDRVISYALVNDLWQPQQTLAPIEGSISEGFGRSIDLSSDGSLLAVSTGLGNTDDALELYRWQADQWQHFQTINPDNLNGFDDFGLITSIEPTRLITSTARFDNGDKNKGRVWVYRFDNTSYQLESSILPPSNVPGTIFTFGDALDLSPDGTRLLVGAGTNSYGSAFVFGLEGSDWVQEGELRNPINGADNKFGRAVLLFDDTAYIGGPLRDTSDSLDPLVAGFNRDANGDWAHNGQILRGAAGVPDTFGTNIAYDGTTMLVGAPGRNEDGEADAFIRNANGFTKVASLEPQDQISSELVLMLLTQAPNFASQELWRTPSTSEIAPAMIALENGGALIVTSDTSQVTLWAWSGVGQELIAISQASIANTASEELAIGELLFLQGQYYWLRQTSVTEKTLSRFNMNDATLGESVVLRSLASHRTSLVQYNNTWYVALDSNTAGFCRWQAIDLNTPLALLSGSANVLVDEVICEAALSNTIGDAIVFTTLSSMGFTQYQVLAEQGAGQTSFVVRVSDENSNSTALTVELKWQ